LRLDFQHEQRLPGENHVAVAKAVDQHGLRIFEVADHLVRNDAWFVSILFFEAEGVENRLPGLADIGLAVGVQFKHAVVPLDDLHARRYIRGL